MTPIVVPNKSFRETIKRRQGRSRNRHRLGVAGMTRKGGNAVSGCRVASIATVMSHVRAFWTYGYVITPKSVKGMWAADTRRAA